MNEVRGACLGHLRRYLPVRPGVRKEVRNDQGREVDLELLLPGRPTERLLVEVKTAQNLTREHLHHVIAQLEAFREGKHDHPMLWAPWIPDTLAEDLRKGKFLFVDAVGNAYVDLPRRGILIDVRGRRPERKPGAEPGRLIEPASLKVIHHLLAHPGGINRPQREIAKEAGVALGTVAITMKQLRLAGYVVKAGRTKRRLERRDDLIEQFVRGYGLKLRPTCFLGRFRHPLADPEQLWDRMWTTLEPKGIRTAMTGANAALAWTKHMRPDALTLFVDRRALEILKADKEKLLPDPQGGNLTLLDFFGPTVWDPAPNDPRHCATQLLVYAELLHDGRPRELETARMILDRMKRESHAP